MTTLTDDFGREVTVTSDGVSDIYSADGLELSYPAGTPEATAVNSLNGMAPAGWVAPPPPVLLNEVALFQARIVLAGMPSATGDPAKTFLDDVDTALKAMGSNSPAYIAWEYGNNVARNGPLVLAMAAQFGLSDAQLDRMFAAAAAIVV